MKYPILIILNNENVIVVILIRHISNFNNNSAILIFYDYVKMPLKFYIYVKLKSNKNSSKKNIKLFNPLQFNGLYNYKEHLFP